MLQFTIYRHFTISRDRLQSNDFDDLTVTYIEETLCKKMANKSFTYENILFT